MCLLSFKLSGVYRRLWLATNPVVYPPCLLPNYKKPLLKTVKTDRTLMSAWAQGKNGIQNWPYHIDAFKRSTKPGNLLSFYHLINPLLSIWSICVWFEILTMFYFWSMFDRFKVIWSNKNVGLSTIVELFDLAITRLHAVGINGHGGKCNDIVLCLASPWHLSIFVSESVRLLSEHC